MIKKELQQELNRTKLVLDYARQEIKEKDKEIERLNNIIDKAREYVESNKQYAELEDYGKNGEYYIDEIGLLEILDKVGSDKE